MTGVEAAEGQHHDGCYAGSIKSGERVPLSCGRRDRDVLKSKAKLLWWGRQRNRPLRGSTADVRKWPLTELGKDESRIQGTQISPLVPLRARYAARGTQYGVLRS